MNLSTTGLQKILGCDFITIDENQLGVAYKIQIPEGVDFETYVIEHMKSRVLHTEVTQLKNQITLLERQIDNLVKYQTFYEMYRDLK